MFKLDLEQADEPEIKLLTSLDHRESKEILGKHHFCFTDYAQDFDLCGSQQSVENSSRDGNTRPPYLSPEK